LAKEKIWGFKNLHLYADFENGAIYFCNRLLNIMAQNLIFWDCVIFFLSENCFLANTFLGCILSLMEGFIFEISIQQHSGVFFIPISTHLKKTKFGPYSFANTNSVVGY
jgi:hypothetical protein